MNGSSVRSWFHGRLYRIWPYFVAAAALRVWFVLLIVGKAHRICLLSDASSVARDIAFEEEPVEDTVRLMPMAVALSC